MNVKELITELLDMSMEAKIMFNDKHNTERDINRVAPDLSRGYVWLEEGDD